MENCKTVIYHITWNSYQRVYGERRIVSIMGEWQTTVEIYHHELAMSCIDASFSASLTIHISVMCIPSNCRDSPHGLLQDWLLYLEWKEFSSREEKGRWDKGLIWHWWAITATTWNVGSETHYQTSRQKTYRKAKKENPQEITELPYKCWMRK